MGVNIQTIKDIKFYLSAELYTLYPEPEIRALSNIIIKTVFRVSTLQALALPETPVTRNQKLEIYRICGELKTGKPIQYITGETYFYNCRIRVNKDTLIPRPETEELVDHIIKENKGFSGSILDIGTGSGCIAIALAINLPGSSVTGIDNSEGAIIMAEKNAKLNNTKVKFFVEDILNPDPARFGRKEIIVSNPPYVRNLEKTKMANNVLDYEPHTALFVPDDDPLKYFSAIIMLAHKIHVPGGKLYFEINEAMGSLMVNLLETCGYHNIEIIKDINGRERIIKCIRNE